MMLHKTINFFRQPLVRDRTQKICDLSFHPCNNDISFTSTGTWACGLGFLCSWMVHETFAYLA